MANHNDLGDHRFEIAMNERSMNETTGLAQLLVHASHKVVACGKCCADFGLLHQIQPKIPPNQAMQFDTNLRHQLFEKEIKSYYFDSSTLVVIQNETCEQNNVSETPRADAKS